VLGALLCMLQQKAGFDRTRVGSILLPRIPRSWRRHMLLNRFCVILVVAMEIVLFTVNWIVTVPRPEVRENTAAQVNLSLPAASAAPEATNLPVITTEPEATAVPVVTTEPEATAVPVVTPVPEATDVPAPTPEVEITDVTVIAPEPVPAAERVYNTDNLALEARNVLLVRLAGDGGSAEVIYAAGSSESIYPASTLKMLTALTVLDAASPGDQVQIGTEIYIPPLDASRAGLEYGMTLTVRELLEGLLLPSGADAAYALGVYCGRQLAGDSQLSAEQAVARFIEEMNRKASALGASDTTVKNVVGLDDKGQKTTAEDILRIAKAFLDQPVLAEICSLPTDRITSAEGKSVSLSNTNKMLHLDSGYYNGDIAGVKTGTTSRAGNCLVSVFTIQGERYLCVVMHSSYYGKFTDTQMLYDMCADACGN